ncbi:MAG: periplasmic heavy metal sensor [Kiritimatiellae bacterium]|nr:periplasmic heavy metal sensor [Kiritimatiellia bacterium]
MKMNTRMVAVVAAVSLAAGLAGAEQPEAGAPRGGHGRFGGRGQGPLAELIRGQIGRIMVLSSELGVTAEQKTQIREIVQGYRDEIKPVALRVKEAHRALGDAVTAQTPTEEAIRKAADNLGAAAGDAAVLAAHIVADVRTVLTPEQIERLEQFKAEKRKATDEWVERHHGR